MYAADVSALECPANGMMAFASLLFLSHGPITCPSRGFGSAVSPSHPTCLRNDWSHATPSPRFYDATHVPRRGPPPLLSSSSPSR